jgi:hypothetical protein
MGSTAAPVRRTYAVLALLVDCGAALGPTACGSPDTVVLVGVQGMTPPIRQLDVEATVGTEKRSLRVPEQPATDPFFLPTNFTLQIPRSLSGTLRVSVTALDASGRAIATGSGMIPLEVGVRNELTVMIGVPPPDAGPPDAAADAPAPDAPSPDVTPDAEDGPGDLGGADAGASVAPDAPVDMAPDAGLDAPADSASDGSADTSRDGG